MILRLRTEVDARNILDHFNQFHDGFIKEVSLRSHDCYEKHGPGVADITHTLTGTFDAVIDIAHYNYGQGTQPLDRTIRCQFRDVRDFHLDLRGVRSYEWNIQKVEIQSLQRKTESNQMEQCFSLIFCWSKLIDNQWSEGRDQLLTFIMADFEDR